MPVFIDPIYNLLCAAWVSGNKPSIGPADFSAIPCQLYYNSRIGQPLIAQYLLRIDVSAIPSIDTLTIFEVIEGSTKYFRNTGSFWVHRGFPNEYWSVDLEQCDQFGTTQPATLP